MWTTRNSMTLPESLDFYVATVLLRDPTGMRRIKQVEVRMLHLMEAILDRLGGSVVEVSYLGSSALRPITNVLTTSIERTQ
jgi:hypothetical protein